MDDPLGASGRKGPNRIARCLLAGALALVCAPLALAQAPPVAQVSAAPAQLPPGAGAGSMRLPPVVPVAETPTLIYGYQLPAGSDPFAGQQVNYVFAGPEGQEVAPSGDVQLVARRSLLNFAGLQDEPGDAANNDRDEDEPPPKADKPEDQQYGQAPTNNSLQFLRTVDVLLKPGAWQADSGFVYTHFSNDFPLPIVDPMTGEIINVVEAELRRRLLFTPLAVRYGWTNNIQLFAALPAGFSNTQRSTLGLSETRNVSGIGDLTFGASFHLIKGECGFPDVIGTLGITAPTGKFDTPLFGLVPGSNLGQGFWAYSLQALCIHRYDPIIVFYGGGYRHLWERPFDGFLFQPGEQANYMFGVGFAVNDRITLSSTFQGFYITNTFIDGVNIRGSNLEPLSMRFSVTIVRDCRIIEPFCQFGLTDSAPNANVGLTVTFY
jgi:hypothetical protein